MAGPVAGVALDRYDRRRIMIAADIGYTGTELREDINSDPEKLKFFEAIRVAGALRMGLIKNPEEALTRQHTPKIAFVAPPTSYTASSGKTIAA